MSEVFEFIILVLCLTSLHGQNTTDLVVETTAGKVHGRQAQTLDKQKTYFAFQGIPYAEPPIDDLRFRAPVPAKNWDKVLTAQEDERKCIQDLNSKGSEDCLYINVFTPKIETPNLPVMVWIYGGAFYAGNSKIEEFGPDYFLEEDVIVVTFNYRLGVFGFLSTEDEAASGNWAIKDQLLALKWVKENIANFGGNPKRVTLFGESAGSASVSYLLQTRYAKDLFQAAIMQSGTTLNPWALTRNPKATAFAIGKALDIDTDNTTILVEALQRVETKTLQAASVSTNLAQTILTNPLDGLIFGPSLEPRIPGAVIVRRSHERLKEGDFNRVPLIVGFNSEEGLPLKDVIEFVRPYLFSYDVFSTRLIPVDMKIENGFQRAMVAFLIRQKYFGLLPVTLSNERLVQFVTDDQFVRSIHEYVSIVSKFVPLYYYRFSYEGPLGVDGKSRQSKGVAHAEELNYLWRKKDNIPNPPAADFITRKRLVKLWTNFAKTFNPTPVQDELLQYVTWPTSIYNNITYLDIGQDLKLTSDMSIYSIQFWKDLYKNNGYPPYDTY